MKKIAVFNLILLSFLLFCSYAFAESHILDVSSGKIIPFSDMIKELQNAHYVFIGDDIDVSDHQLAQLEVITVLNEKKEKLAVGIEMFRSDSQYILDQWIANEISKRRFVDEFSSNWDDWPRYRRLFQYIRDNNIKLVGLNASRDILIQVEVDGFDSLTPSQLGSLEGITCDIEPDYQDVMRRMRMYKDPLKPQSFLHFCEAKILADNVMAKNLALFHKKHPDHIIIVLAGNNHCWKHGIPSRIDQRSEMKAKVLLLEAPGRVNRNTITPEEADYLWLDYGKTGWWR